jgi:hypothetical protein
MVTFDQQGAQARANARQAGGKVLYFDSLAWIFSARRR